MRHPTMRAARCAAACLLLGALTAVVVAWSLRGYYQWRNPPPSPRWYSLEESGERWEATTRRGPGRFSIVYQKLPPPGSQWQMIRTQGQPDPIPFTDEPAWAAAARRANPELLATSGYGLPWACVMSFSKLPASGAVESVGVFTTPLVLGTVGRGSLACAADLGGAGRGCGGVWKRVVVAACGVGWASAGAAAAARAVRWVRV
jgi:hypothetical protein